MTHINPFSGTTVKITKANDLFGREEQLDELKHRIREGLHTVIMGVEGVGKSSLLACVYSNEFRTEMARNNVLLSYPIEFTENIGKLEIYQKLRGAIEDAIPFLEQLGETETYKAAVLQRRMSSIDRARPENERFVSAMAALADNEFRMVFLIDNFEFFTSSPEITMEHHEVLRSLLENSQYIVATNSDLNRDSLPANVSGSYLLMNFANGELTVTGLSKEECKSFLLTKLEGNEISFSEKLIDNIYIASGGIPCVVNKVAHAAYIYIQENHTEKDLKIKDSVYNDDFIQRLFKRWSTMLTNTQVKVLKNLADFSNRSGQISGDMQMAATCLVKRGILNYYSELDQHNRLKVSNNRYVINSKLYSSFCREPSLLDQAALGNPLRQAISVSGDPFEQLIELLGTEDISREAVIERINIILQQIGGVNLVIDFNSEITQDDLSEFYITPEDYSSMNEEVRIHIREGIQLRNCLANTVLEDYGPVCLSFCKALETYLYYTLIPIMKKVFQTSFINYNGRRMRFSDINHRNMALGQIHYVLDYATPYGTKWYMDICDVMASRGITIFSEKDWDTYVSDLKTSADCRNDCPHKGAMTQKRYEEFLKTVFYSENSFMKRSLRLYAAAQASALV